MYMYMYIVIFKCFLYFTTHKVSNQNSILISDEKTDRLI